MGAIMDKICNISPKCLTEGEKEVVYDFLKNYIPQGTVVMQPSVYDSASNWSILYGSSNQKILGFSAQKLFDFGHFNVIQIMGTFLSESIRGKNLASVLMQGHLFSKVFFKNPFKQIYWCTRTRIPAAYAASIKHEMVLPCIKSIDNNLKYSRFSEFVVKTVYGQHVEFDQYTYKIRNSYYENSKFIEVPRMDKKSKITDYFMQHIDYKKNEAIFITSKIKNLSLLKYLVVILIFKSKSLGSVIKNNTTRNI